jgi:hypothetical protein
LVTTRRTVYTRHLSCRTLPLPPRMRVATDWHHFPHPLVHPTQNTGNAVSGVIISSHRPPSTTQIIIVLRPNTAARPSRTPLSGVTSPMRAVSGVFDRIWNCPKPKAAGINQLVSEIDLYPITTTLHDPAIQPTAPSTCIHSHPQPSSSPPFASLPLIIIRFRDIPLLSTCSAALSLCFRVCSYRFFHFLCLFLPHPLTRQF